MAEDTGIAVVEGENPPAEVVETEQPSSTGIDVDALWDSGVEKKVQSYFQKEIRHLENRVAETDAKYQMALDYMAEQFDDDFAGDRALLKRLIAQGLDADEAAKVKDDVKLRREIAAVRATQAAPQKRQAPPKADDDADPELTAEFKAGLVHVSRSLTAYARSLGLDYAALFEAGKFGDRTPPPTKDDPTGLLAYEAKARKVMRAHKDDIEKRANPTPTPSATGGRGGDKPTTTWEKAQQITSATELSPEQYFELVGRAKG